MHGYAYYDTKIAVRHPSLKRDLLGEMLQALRPAGIAANYYYGLTWDALAAARHPEWRILDRAGKPVIFGGHNSGVRVAAGLPQLPLPRPGGARERRDPHPVSRRRRLVRHRLDAPRPAAFASGAARSADALGLADSAADIKRHNKMVAMRMEAAPHRAGPSSLA